MQTEQSDRTSIKRRIKELKELQHELRCELNTLPKAESKQTNNHLPRRNGRYTSSLPGIKVPKQLLLRSSTVNLIESKAATSGKSISEFVDLLITTTFANDESDTKISFKIE